MECLFIFPSLVPGLLHHDNQEDGICKETIARVRDPSITVYTIRSSSQYFFAYMLDLSALIAHRGARSFSLERTDISVIEQARNDGYVDSQPTNKTDKCFKL